MLTRTPLTQGMRRCQPATECNVCAVRKRALFQGVPGDQLNWMQEYRQSQMEVAAKEHLFIEGKKAQDVYTLHDGWAMIYKSLPNGKRQIMRIALSGDFLGFQGNLNDPMSYGIECITPCTVCAFPRSRFREMLLDHSPVATRLAEMNARYMAICQNHLLCTGRKPAKERLAYLFMELYTRIRLRDQGVENKVPLPLGQEEIADAVGLTNVHVSRTLSELKPLVECSSKILTIKDHKGLMELADFDPSIVTDGPCY